MFDINDFDEALPGPWEWDVNRLAASLAVGSAAGNVRPEPSRRTLVELGRDDGDPLFMQVKEAQPSVLEAFVAPSTFGNAGERVMTGQRLMQSASDVLLGWVRAAGPDGQDATTTSVSFATGRARRPWTRCARV